MGRYRFNLSVDFEGVDVEEYKIIKLGKRQAKVINSYEKDGSIRVVVLGVYKYHDFYMEIETIWELSRMQKTFKILTSSVEIDMFNVDWLIFVVPEDHIDALKRWHKTFKGTV